MVTTLNILTTIANAMGSSSVKYVKTLMPGTIGVLSDSKVCALYIVFQFLGIYVCMLYSYTCSLLPSFTPQDFFLNWF